jgi:hypothetical protein
MRGSKNKMGNNQGLLPLQQTIVQLLNQGSLNRKQVIKNFEKILTIVSFYINSLGQIRGHPPSRQSQNLP